ncbi:hypothetical protein GQ457_02G015570 [Hibiscus cannabinus]
MLFSPTRSPFYAVEITVRASDRRKPPRPVALSRLNQPENVAKEAKQKRLKPPLQTPLKRHSPYLNTKASIFILSSSSQRTGANDRRGWMGAFGEGGRRSKFPYFSCFIHVGVIKSSVHISVYINYLFLVAYRIILLVQFVLEIQREECMFWKLNWIKLILKFLQWFQQFVSYPFGPNSSNVGLDVFELSFFCPQDVPYIFNLEWSVNSRLKNLVHQFEEHLEKLQGFWSTLEEIDRSLQIVDSKHASRAIVSRQIQVGNDCFMILSININDPRSLPECRFMGSSNVVNSLRKTWKRNVDRWVRDNAFSENLERLLNTQLPRPADEEKNNHLDECGICYAQYLPIGSALHALDVSEQLFADLTLKCHVGDEHGPKTGNATDYTCENNSCSKAFHSMCLVDWLRSITTTRQSFNVLFGNCPYCSEPIAVKINATKN